MTAFDPTNPFANNAAHPAVVINTQPRLGTLTPQVTFLPTVPGSAGTIFTANDRANIVSSLAYVVAGLANSQFLTLNPQQVTAINNVYAEWTATNPYGTTLPGTVTVPAPSLQDTVIALQAVGYLQTTGLLTTQADLLASNGQIQLVTGFAPNGASTLTIHNQKVVACVPGDPFWYASNVGNAASWDALSAGDLETYSDQPVAADQCYGYLVVFGEQSMEWFYDNGGQPLPYAAVTGSAQNIGLPAIHSRKNFMGNLVFLGRFKTGQMHVMQTNGTGVPTIISTSDIDQIINSFPNGQYQDAVAATDDFNGHPVYILTFLSAKRTFVFDGLTQIWSEMQSGTAEYQRHMTTLRATLNNGTLASDWESGNVYIVDPNNYTDSGYIIKREWVSKHVKNSGNIFSVTMLELIMQVGTGSQRLGPTGASGASLTLVSGQQGVVYGFDAGVIGSITGQIGNSNIAALATEFTGGENTIIVELTNAASNLAFTLSWTDCGGVARTLNSNAATYLNEGTVGVWEFPPYASSFPAFANGATYQITTAGSSSVAAGPTNPALPFTPCPHIELSVSTDGGFTWSQAEPAELGEVGQYSTRVYWRQLGTGRDFLFKFRCTDPVPFVVVAGYASIEPGEPD